MAKTRESPKADKDQNPAPVRRGTVLTIKGTEEWKEWLSGLSDHLRIPTSTIVDLALVQFAKSEGYEPAPPKR
jgi:hypothetical protein